MAWRKDDRDGADVHRVGGRGARRARRQAGASTCATPRHGHHVEADLSKQVLALIDNGDRVERIYHISSGKPSTPTVLGSFHVYRKSPGTNSHGMVHSSYFIGGYAIHGYFDVPDLRGQPRLPAGADPERVVDLHLGADGRHRRRLSVMPAS